MGWEQAAGGRADELAGRSRQHCKAAAGSRSTTRPPPPPTTAPGPPAKLIERRSTRAGVPVLSRSVSNPSSTRRSVRPVDAASPARPADIDLRPTQICGGLGSVGRGAARPAERLGMCAAGHSHHRDPTARSNMPHGSSSRSPRSHATPCRPRRPRPPALACPFMKVPVVSTAARQRNVMPKKVVTPVTSSFGPTSTLVAMPARAGDVGGATVRHRQDGQTHQSRVGRWFSTIEHGAAAALAGEAAHERRPAAHRPAPPAHSRGAPSRRCRLGVRSSRRRIVSAYSSLSAPGRDFGGW